MNEQVGERGKGGGGEERRRERERERERERDRERKGGGQSCHSYLATVQTLFNPVWTIKNLHLVMMVAAKRFTCIMYKYNHACRFSAHVYLLWVV